MGAQSNVAPVIIKRKKGGGGDGHHGGAWKVAYADFVTAMMAFFLLMWLLNATTEKQRKGLADYFSPTIPVHRVSSGSEQPFGGDSVFSQDVLMTDGTGGTAPDQMADRKTAGEAGIDVDLPEEDDPLSALEDELMGRGGESLVTEEALKHIVTRVTDEGLVIELFALDGEPIFEPGTDQPTELLEELLGMIARVSNKVTNGVAVSGHVASNPIVARENPVWELSQDRADRIRSGLESDGIAASRMQRVTGHADRKPAVTNRMAARNDRIEITLLRSEKSKGGYPLGK